MPLHYPKSLSLTNFNGGYYPKASPTMVADDASVNAQNCEINLEGSIVKRFGYRRQLDTALTTLNNSGGLRVVTSQSGDNILGHFQLIKSGEAVQVFRRVVAAGRNLWSYSSQTATVIAQGLNSSAFWTFAQIQDPRSASDDIVVMTNGRDNPRVWNGTEASAADLSTLISATGVVPAKFIQSLKNRLYLLNVNDDTDVDSNSKVVLSGFDSTTGAPRPQRFEQSFYVGGSDDNGEITGSTILNDQLIIFKRKATYKFAPGSGELIDTAQLVQMDEQIGCIAPHSIAVAGNVCLFLGELGVFAFDGNNFTYISEGIEPELINSNKRFIHDARGVYYRSKNQYWLAIPDQGSELPEKVLVYDLTKKIWFPPQRGFKSTILSTYLDLKNNQKVVRGDNLGFVYVQDTGYADGVTATYSGTVYEVLNSGSILILNTANTNIPFENDGIGGAKLRITEGTGLDKEYTIVRSYAEPRDLVFYARFDGTANTTSTLMPDFVMASASITTVNDGNVDSASFRSGILSLNSVTDLTRVNYNISNLERQNRGRIFLSIRSNICASLADFPIFDYGNTAGNSIRLSYSGTSAFKIDFYDTAGFVSVPEVEFFYMTATLLTTASFTTVELSFNTGVISTYINGQNLQNYYTDTINGLQNPSRLVVGDYLTSQGTNGAADFDLDFIAVYNINYSAQGDLNSTTTLFTTQTYANAVEIASDENATGLDTSSKYLIGGIPAFWRTKDYDFGSPDIVKKYKRITVRTIQEGSHNLNVQYIVDFKALSFVPTATISLLSDGPIFNTATYGNVRFGNTELLTKKVSLRSTSLQSLTGRNFSIRFENNRPFEPFEVTGFDIQVKETGRR